ncbi:MAG: hypothetical protein KA369_17070 [Spirochaetes bacterium]|nr:hypothetical protein [Spirochaetota bacterium]
MAPVEMNEGKRHTVRLFRREDAPQITKLFRAVYGDGYPARFVYDPEKIIEAFEKGESYSIVAVMEDGSLAGQCSLFRSSPYRGLYENGAGLVLPQYRKMGINEDILDFIYKSKDLAARLGMEELWGEAVCNHVFMQKAVLRHGAVETALEVDLMPSEAYEKEKSAGGRVAAINSFICYRPRTMDIHAPRAYEDALAWIYGGLDDSRMIRPAAGELPGIATVRDVQLLEFARVARINVDECGSDFRKSMEELEEDLKVKNMAVTQVRLKLTKPWIGGAVEILRSMGYFFGGPLPRWFDDDGLLMQKTHGTPDWEAIHLHSDRARRIRDLVFEDWRAVTGG